MKSIVLAIFCASGAALELSPNPKKRLEEDVSAALQGDATAILQRKVAEMQKAMTMLLRENEDAKRDRDNVKSEFEAFKKENAKGALKVKLDAVEYAAKQNDEILKEKDNEEMQTAVVLRQAQGDIDALKKQNVKLVQALQAVKVKKQKNGLATEQLEHAFASQQKLMKEKSVLQKKDAENMKKAANEARASMLDELSDLKEDDAAQMHRAQKCEKELKDVTAAKDELKFDKDKLVETLQLMMRTKLASEARGVEMKKEMEALTKQVSSLQKDLKNSAVKPCDCVGGNKSTASSNATVSLKKESADPQESVKLSSAPKLEPKQHHMKDDKFDVQVMTEMATIDAYSSKTAEALRHNSAVGKWLSAVGSSSSLSRSTTASATAEEPEDPDLQRLKQAAVEMKV